MKPKKCLVLDANILIRGVLGQKVRSLIEQNIDNVNFYTPNVCYEDALKYLPSLMIKRNLSVEKLLAVLDTLLNFVVIVDLDFYSEFEDNARPRIEKRDINDWQIIALALALDCPIWTEDQDFFGSGVATWTTDRVHLYLTS
jgi:predicted nucleic acid-binding protein